MQKYERMFGSRVGKIRRNGFLRNFTHVDDGLFQVIMLGLGKGNKFHA